MGLHEHVGSDAAQFYEDIAKSRDLSELDIVSIGAATTYAATKQYDEYVAKNGPLNQHNKTVEVLVGMAQKYLQELIETNKLYPEECVLIMEHTTVAIYHTMNTASQAGEKY
ncbi:uncharacterized protein GIQ15_06092 [Arthroderma uncinatum]|uniref:uncharacterized protein n=1 Tax=Arthroderma uncinatum TaxID=74035 RepID=UPI00144A9C09|nr:uncharacterized protein GIQ15_06092 [Arthroderma uncinatum]KAF3480745.1 hypothetical protein GIQ15_06092 [Arthroderma uncinatum]